MLLVQQLHSLASAQELALFLAAVVPLCGDAEAQGRQKGAEEDAKWVSGWQESFAFGPLFGISALCTKGLNTADGNTPGERLHKSMKRKVSSKLGFLVVVYDDPFSLCPRPAPPPYPEE